jgi:penicillin-binding protein 2
MGLAGLEFKQSPTRQVFCPGFFTLTKGGHRYRCWKHSGHGAMDMHDSIVQSCDVYFYDLARTLGIERMHDYLDGFGFGRKTGIDMHGESAALLPSRKWKRGARDEPWYPGETVIAGIGQGYMLATPLQLASATAALANGGVRMRPHFLLAEQNPMDNQVIAVDLKAAQPRVSSSEAIPLVQAAMVDVTSGARGTARRIGEGSPYSIAAKTGTAQVIGIKQNEKYNEDEIDERHRDHALFIAYAPAENPTIAVAVIVENGGHGGSTAGPIARQVLDYHLLGKLPEPPKVPVEVEANEVPEA